MARERGVTARQKREFLELVAAGDSITKAADKIDRHPSVFLNRADRSHAIYDEVFATAFAEALNQQAAVNAGRADGDMDEWAHEDDAPPAIRLAWAKRWNPAYREQQQVAVTGSMEVHSDVAAAIERFTTEVVRLSAGHGQGAALEQPDDGAEGGSDVPVGRLERAAEPGRTGG